MVLTGAVAAGVVIGWHLALMLRCGVSWRGAAYAVILAIGISMVAWWAASPRAAAAVAGGMISGALLSARFAVWARWRAAHQEGRRV